MQAFAQIFAELPDVLIASFVGFFVMLGYMAGVAI
jgi:hypothetical protein